MHFSRASILLILEGRVRMNSTGTQWRSRLQDQYKTQEFWWACSLYLSVKHLFPFNSSNRLDVALIHYSNSDLYYCKGQLLVAMSLLMAVWIVAIRHRRKQQNRSCLTGGSTQSPIVHKAALKAAVLWECPCAWIYEASLNKALKSPLLRKKS